MEDVTDTVRRILEQAREKGRGGPRSRLVDAIMVLLLSRPMRSSEMAAVLGYEAKYISSYLSYWKARGFVEYVNGYWSLTPQGEEYAEKVLERETAEDVDKMASIARRILSTYPVKDTINHKEKEGKRGGGSGSLSFIAPRIGKGHNELQERVQRAKCILEVYKDDLDEEELEVLSSLLSHYTKWGSTYIYLDNLADVMEADYHWLLRIARRLQSKGIIYIYTDPRLGVRIGLTKNMKETLKSCTGDH
ncbi:MAG: replication initiator protein WhiP [Desulfurococcales archaeon]|nr:replication initiator protein WhiP [Desulfurococcales archaeon]